MTEGVIDVVGSPNSEADFYQHGSAMDCMKSLQKLKRDFNQYYSFCIVRNPWERYYSFFKYYKNYLNMYRNQDPSIDWSDVHTTRQGRLCEEIFMNKTDQIVLRNIILNNPPQSDYYLNTDDQVMVSHIARFENINEEFRLLCDTTHIPSTPLLHKNMSSNRSDHQSVYTQQLIDMVAEKEKHVIQLNSYTYK